MEEKVYPPYSSTHRERELSIQLDRARRELSELRTLHDDLLEDLSRHIPPSMEDDVALESIISEWAERAARGIPAPVPTLYHIIITYQVGGRTRSRSFPYDTGIKGTRNRAQLLKYATLQICDAYEMSPGGTVLFFSIEPMELA